jgi:hypothetical protein
MIRLHYLLPLTSSFYPFFLSNISLSPLSFFTLSQLFRQGLSPFRQERSQQTLRLQSRRRESNQNRKWVWSGQPLCSRQNRHLHRVLIAKGDCEKAVDAVQHVLAMFKTLDKTNNNFISGTYTPISAYFINLSRPTRQSWLHAWRAKKGFTALQGVNGDDLLGVHLLFAKIYLSVGYKWAGCPAFGPVEEDIATRWVLKCLKLCSCCLSPHRLKIRSAEAYQYFLFALHL